MRLNISDMVWKVQVRRGRQRILAFKPELCYKSRRRSSGPCFERSMLHRPSHIHSSRLVVLLLACLLLAMAPFAAALEIHHELAAADHDGHEHSDTDLCQWVQYHTGHSLVGDAPATCSFLMEAPPPTVYQSILTSQSLATTRSSRAPPRS